MSSSLQSSPAVGRPMRSISGSSMPSAPNMGRPLRTASTSSMPSGAGRQQAQHQPTGYAQSIGKSMTIEEMRRLHQRALSDAEAKRTELRLVLASRYRELVGSSDEVLRMRERSQELHQLVHALPSLMSKMAQSAQYAPQEGKEEKEDGDADSGATIVRRDLSRLPRVVHRALDRQDVHTAAVSLMRLFDLIASHTDAYPLANALSKATSTLPTTPLDPILSTQIKMTFLHVQTIPSKTIRLAKQVLSEPAADGASDNASGAHKSAAALSALNLLDVTKNADKAVQLLDLYFDSKAKLLLSLLNRLTTAPPTSSKDDKQVATDGGVETENAEQILSQIVLILQYDIIMNPCQIFVKRGFQSNTPGGVQAIMSSMPLFDADVVKSKASHFLAAHLPLIRNKVKSILVTIAGTTASALGKIRQSLYDKTDGVECMERLDSNEVCTWEEAVNAMVDVRIVLSHGSHGVPEPTSKKPGQVPRKFSLWSALFSNTFSSLVHSLLTTSFHSVHARVVSTLRTSLANAPPFSAMLPHEAYRNTMRIATELDADLLKVSDDAHELLVHAEEREESERRLRQSLYVQTCEIMGRLVCELRRMLLQKGRSESDATKEFIVGRLCYLLKFRLTSLPTLLDPNSSPAVLAGGGTSGMITLLELQSAFDLADDNDDGLITFEEAMEAVDSAFSGTQFHGGEMVRETLLLTSKTEETPAVPGSQSTAAPTNVTLNELALLSARGLRHDASGSNSALGTIQTSLDDIVGKCFAEWASAALISINEPFLSSLKDFIELACTASETEWKRIHLPMDVAPVPSGTSTEPLVENVSPHVVGFLLSVSSVLSRSVCPSDSIVPVPSMDYAAALGIPCDSDNSIPSMTDTIRCALLRQTLSTLVMTVDKEVNGAMVEAKSDEGESQAPRSSLSTCGPSALIQLHMDISFLRYSMFTRNRHGFSCGVETDERNDALVTKSQSTLKNMSSLTEQLVRKSTPRAKSDVFNMIADRHAHVVEVCDLFLASLFGEGEAASPLTLEDDLGADLSSSTTATPLLQNPLPSSRRFVLLPIQNDRSLSELQRRGKYGKDRDDRVDNRQDTGGSGVIGSGLGFISSMLKKK